MLLEVEPSRPTLFNLCLSTKSLLNEENKIIIEQINFIRRIRGVPPLMLLMDHLRKLNDRTRGKISLSGSKPKQPVSEPERLTRRFNSYSNFNNVSLLFIGFMKI